MSNERFLWLGKLVLDERPDVIVEMGDFADMESLSSYDKGKLGFEGRRYSKDIESANEALSLFNGPIREYNQQQKKNGKKQYRPRKIAILGNHEDRITRAINSSPELDGTISVEDIYFKTHGWEVIPYRIPIQINGVSFCHSFPSGVKGEAVSGANIAASLLAKHMCSVVVGHIHTLDHATRVTPNGNRYHGLSVGCYHSHTDKFAESTAYMWYRGVCILHDVKEGDYDLETISINRIRENYGTKA